MSSLPSFVQRPPNMITLILKNAGVIKLGEFGTNPFYLHFPVNPESLNILKNYLVSVTNTPGGGWVDDYGQAPHSFTLSGTFGRATKGWVGSVPKTGFGWVKYLEWMVDRSHEANDEGELPELYLYSWISQHFFRVVTEPFRQVQSISRNTLWIYTLRLTALPEQALAFGDVPDQIGVEVINSALSRGINEFSTIMDMRL